MPSEQSNPPLTDSAQPCRVSLPCYRGASPQSLCSQRWFADARPVDAGTDCNADLSARGISAEHGSACDEHLQAAYSLPRWVGPLPLRPWSLE